AEWPPQEKGSGREQHRLVAQRARRVLRRRSDDFDVTRAHRSKIRRARLGRAMVNGYLSHARLSLARQFGRPLAGQGIGPAVPPANPSLWRSDIHYPYTHYGRPILTLRWEGSLFPGRHSQSGDPSVVGIDKTILFQSVLSIQCPKVYS